MILLFVMRVLGVWLDPGLRWKGHLDAVAGRLKAQLWALKVATTSTWGLPLLQDRMVYNMVIRPVISYGALAWHQSGGGTERIGIGGRAGKLPSTC